MAVIKEESEDVTIEDTFRVKHEDTEEQTDPMPLKEESRELDEMEEKYQYEKQHAFITEEKSNSCSQTEKTSRKTVQNTETRSKFTCQQCGRSFTEKETLKST
ncbi:zinc finger protein 260-like [Onychostoma macrolepis]|uniref:zinc finger protein 260-like n=1 Tax=Onychostoma macrolepis TaxID=369639 RepID=UPI00272A43F5|nr:zinc finger protein 260-like [Onychostoma macrolepis]